MRGLKKKAVGLAISALLIFLIFFVLVPPATAVYVHPGTPSSTSVNTGTTITFNNVNLTIRGAEKIPVNFLNFSIFNSNNQYVAHVKFYINGAEMEDYPSGKFTVTNTTAILSSWYGYGYNTYGYDEITGWNETTYTGYGYGYSDSSLSDITFLYDIGYMTHTTGTFYGKLSANATLDSTTHIYSSSASETFTVSEVIEISNPYPANGSTEISRPTTNLSVQVNGTNLDIYFYFYNMTPVTDTWTQFANWTGVSTQRYEFTNFTDMGNDWIWGNTSYQWTVNVTDGSTWLNTSYHYTTTGSRYDVSNNGDVNVQDLSYTWGNRDGVKPYDGLYDVNNNEVINVQDLSYIWNSRT